MLTASFPAACVSLAVAQSLPSLYSRAPENFTTDSHVVSTDVFTWFTSDGGQMSGPWQPLEGRAAWTGNVPFWEDQVKQMMSANIDILYVHMIDSFDQQRTNLFQALSDLRSQGYDVPKVAPFLDPTIIWNNQPPVDLATTAGKDAFVGEYTKFFQSVLQRQQGPGGRQLSGHDERPGRTGYVARQIQYDESEPRSRAPTSRAGCRAHSARAHPVFNTAFTDHDGSESADFDLRRRTISAIRDHGLQCHRDLQQLHRDAS